jgi:hypothetical protein
MPANTDKFMYVGLSTATTLSAPGYTAGNTSITVGSTTNWPTASGVTFAIDTVTIVNGEEVQDAGSYNEFVGTVATGTTITNVDWVDGAGDTDYSAGSTTRVYIPVSKTRENRLVEGMLVEHDQDGTHGAITGSSATLTGTVQGATVISTGDIQHRSVSLETIRSEMEFDYVASGCVWSGDSYGSTRAASMTAGVVYIGGKRISVSSVTARSFTASKDTYIDVDNTGTLVYTEVTNNAASPALAANSIRLGIIVTDGTDIQNVGSVNQGEENKILPIASSVPYAVTDSLGNLICPRDPNRKILGYRQIVSDFTLSSAQTTPTQITGLSCPVIIPTGRKIKVSLWTMAVQPSSGVGQITIWDGTVNSGTKISHANVPTSNQQAIADCQVTPSTTSKTYNGGVHASALANITVLGSTVPMFIRVELV